MWFIIYFKEHFARIIKDTKESLFGKVPMAVVMLLATGIIGYFINNEYLGKFYMSLICGFGGLGAFCFIVFLFYLFKIPVDIYKENREGIKDLMELQKPKLQIGFDLDRFPGCLDDTSNAYEDPQTGKTVRVAFSQKWRIFVYNSSTTETIKNVEVKLIDINKCLSGGARNLPAVHLKFIHDNNREQRSISINPKSRKFVDVIECFMTSVQIKENIFYVQHIEKNQNHSDLSLFFDNINKEDCKIRIEVEGENTTCKPKDFMVGLRGEVIKMWEA